MKPLDLGLRLLRSTMALDEIREGSRVLDVGCGDGHFLSMLGGRIHSSFGIEPGIIEKVQTSRFTLLPGSFPDDSFSNGCFDAIVMLAVLEHFPSSVLPAVAGRCHQLLAERGKVILTVPSPWVDSILHVLIRLGLADGMNLDEHHGYRVEDTVPLFSGAGFVLETHGSFQMGLNNLFVFRKGVRS